MATIQALFSSPIHELVKQKRALIQLRAESTIEEAMALFQEYHLISAPVYGERDHWIGAGGICNAVMGDKMFIGIVSVVDIVWYLLDAMDLSAAIKSRVVNALGKTPESMSLWEFAGTEPIRNAIEPFSKGIHRALILTQVDGADTFCILTQTDLVRLVWRNLPLLHDVNLFRADVRTVLKNISEVARDAPVCISAGAALVDAVTMMREYIVNAVPVVNENRQVVGTVSMSDFRGLTEKGAYSLPSMSLLQFLSIQQRGTLEHPIRPPVCCKFDEPFVDAVSRLLEAQVHRIWVVDQQGILEDTLSLTDVLKALYKTLHH